jgi:hypothetical protein
LNPYCIGCKVDAGISGKTPEVDLLMPKQFDEERNGRRTDPADDLKSLPVQFLVVAREESSQQRQRTPGIMDQCSFGACADLRVAGRYAICPVTHRIGLTRLSEHC